jgi:hypothetical protein
MTIDDVLRTMAVIDGQNDGSQARAVLVEALHLKLLEDPENFWEFYFDTLNAAHPSPYRILAERLLRSGAVNEETTIGDIPAILAWDAAAAAPQARSNDGDR